MTNSVPSSKFTFNKELKSLVSDASDLIGYNMRGRVFPDACDEGFTLVNSKTRKKSIWTFKSETRNKENEIISWEFEPYTVSAYGYTMTIFNT